MRILLDENLSKQLKTDSGPDYEVKTVRVNLFPFLYLLTLPFTLSKQNVGGY